jgi:branched-chain amino acid transport system permease protein
VTGAVLVEHPAPERSAVDPTRSRSLRAGQLTRSEGRTVVTVVTPPAKQARPRESHRPRYLLVGVLAVVVIVAPWVMPATQLSIAQLVLLAVPSAVALNLVMGVAGQVSLATAAMLAAGAFTAGLISQHAAIGLIPSMICAALVGFLLGLIVGVPSVRIRGLYLLIATLAFQNIVVYVSQRIQNAAVGPGGFLLPSADLFGLPIEDQLTWYFVLLGYAALVILVGVALLRSNLGRSWRAVRNNELTATALGVNVRAAKLSAFGISSAIIAMTGALNAFYQSVVSYDAYTLPLAIQYVAMIIIGGMGSMAGGVVGAVLLTVLPFILQEIVAAIAPGSSIVFNLQLIIYGVAIIVFLRLAPGGLAGLGRRAADRFLPARSPGSTEKVVA